MYISIIKHLRVQILFLQTCMLLDKRATTALSGNNRSNTPTPANTAGPNCCHKNTIATMIWKGPDHKILKNGINNTNCWASDDIKFII